VTQMGVTVGAGHFHTTHAIANYKLIYFIIIIIIIIQIITGEYHVRVVIVKIDLTGLIVERRPAAATVKLGI
jgi:hypothetical protein